MTGAQVAPLSAVWQCLKNAFCFPAQNDLGPDISSGRKLMATRENTLFHRFLRHFCCTAAGEGIYHEGRLMRDHMPSEIAELYACLYWNSRRRQLRGLGLTWSQEQSIRKNVRSSELRNMSLRKSSFLYILGRTLCQRRFFTTPDQNFGLCPEHAQEGDIVVVLDGGKVPYILRERPYPFESTRSERLRAGPTYQFIGECYVDTYMDGREAEKAGIADDDSDRHEYFRKIFRIVIDRIATTVCIKQNSRFYPCSSCLTIRKNLTVFS